jgi:hypothetical protein
MTISNGRVIDRVLDVLKCARNGWVTPAEVAQRLGYKKADHVRLMLKRAVDAGLLDERLRARELGKAGGNPLEYRVAQEWRNDGGHG